MALFDRVEVVLFDLDGTLAATHEILFETYVRFMTAQGGVPSRDEFAGLDGPTITEIVQLLRSRHRPDCPARRRSSTRSTGTSCGSAIHSRPPPPAPSLRSPPSVRGSGSGW
jgi:hypothetical protein